jgi:uncharacterized repeat protein (TIGR03803 family)
MNEFALEISYCKKFAKIDFSFAWFPCKITSNSIPSQFIIGADCMILARTFLLTLIFAMGGFNAFPQTLQTLVSFANTNGAIPTGLTLGNDGNFYGLTDSGGNTNLNNGYGYGTVFKLTPNGSLTTLVCFNNTNGASSLAAPTLGKDGNFYGTTFQGGDLNLNFGYGDGTIFQATTNGTLTKLVDFSYTDIGANPTGLTLGKDGNFYGTTEIGGSNGYGTVFQVMTNGSFTKLVDFSYTATGADPTGLTLGEDGNFYGTTSKGGSSGFGTVFQMTPNGTMTTLVSFSGTADGAYPLGTLTPGNHGNFYGTTHQGGNTNLNSNRGFGTIFQVTTNGNLIMLGNFNGTNGASPIGLTLGKDGAFYGLTGSGGNTNLNFGYGYGTVFKLTTNGILTTLVYFNGTNGAGPTGLTLGKDGNLYGTTGGGGNGNLGTVFRLLIPPVGPTLTLQFLAGYPLLSLYGILGNTYTVEYTANLAIPNWTPILVVPNLSVNPFQMIDPAGVGQSGRFYRAVMQ